MNVTSSSPEGAATPRRSGPLRRVDGYFGISARGSNLSREIRGGLATFFALAYIVVLNPLIIGTAPDKYGNTLGIPQVAAMTALIGGIVTILMGVVSRYPFAIASGMGLNVIVAYAIAPLMSWPQAMGLVVLEGLLLLALVLTGFRTAVFRAIPPGLKAAIAVGVGVFLAFTGFVNSGFVTRVPDAAGTTVPVQLGDGHLHGWPIVVFVLGLAVTISLVVRRVKGAMLIGIVLATAFAMVVEYRPGVPDDAWSLTVPTPPFPLADLVAPPDFGLFGEVSVFGAFTQISVVVAVLLAFTLLLADFFDTMGTMVGVGAQAGLLDERGNLPNARGVLVVDAVGTVLGGLGSTSSNTVFAESATGVGEGARTGLASVVTGALLLVATLFAPLVGRVPFEAATPVLIIVGFMMMTQISQVDFTDSDIGVPAFLAIVTMPFTYSITNGIGMGFVSYVLVMLVKGRARRVHPLLWIVSAAFLVYFAIGPLEALFRG